MLILIYHCILEWNFLIGFCQYETDAQNGHQTCLFKMEKTESHSAITFFVVHHHFPANKVDYRLWIWAYKCRKGSLQWTSKMCYSRNGILSLQIEVRDKGCWFSYECQHFNGRSLPYFKLDFIMKFMRAMSVASFDLWSKTHLIAKMSELFVQF